VDRGVRERAPAPRQRYVAFTDPAGGSGGDSFTIAVAHLEGGLAVMDAVREARPPFQPSRVVAEFASLLQSYGIRDLEGDRYAGSWPSEAFAKHGIRYEPADHPKSQIYGDVLPVLNSGRARLLDHDRLVAQLCGLERRVRAGGHDTIDHAVGGRDDVANSVAGALLRARERRGLPADAAVMDLCAIGRPLVASTAGTPWYN
jgi:hypothetical protein